MKMLVPITIDIPDDKIKELIKDAKTHTNNKEELFNYVLINICKDVKFNIPYKVAHLYSCDVIPAVKDFMEK